MHNESLSKYFGDSFSNETVGGTVHGEFEGFVPLAVIGAVGVVV